MARYEYCRHGNRYDPNFPCLECERETQDSKDKEERRKNEIRTIAREEMDKPIVYLTTIECDDVYQLWICDTQECLKFCLAQSLNFTGLHSTLTEAETYFRERNITVRLLGQAEREVTE